MILLPLLGAVANSRPAWSKSAKELDGRAGAQMCELDTDNALLQSTPLSLKSGSRNGEV